MLDPARLDGVLRRGDKVRLQIDAFRRKESFVARDEHEDRQVAPPADQAADSDAVEVRRADVEDHDVGGHRTEA